MRGEIAGGMRDDRPPLGAPVKLTVLKSHDIVIQVSKRSRLVDFLDMESSQKKEYPSLYFKNIYFYCC